MYKGNRPYKKAEEYAGKRGGDYLEEISIFRRRKLIFFGGGGSGSEDFIPQSGIT
jgi:hypothetical protein